MFKKSKFLIVLLVFALALTLLTGCGGQDQSGNADAEGQSATEEVIKIGTVGPLTGDVATYGISTKNGVEIAVDEFNNNGGINGKKIQLISEDTGGDQTEAANATSKLIDQDKVVAIVGGVISAETLTGGPIANDSKVVMISSSSTATGY